jgi:hypothetical protein
MDTAPDSESPELTHRRRRSSAWQRTPKWVKISVAVCLGLLAISLLLQDWIMDLAKRRHRTSPSEAVQASKAARVQMGKAFDSITSKLAPIDLELTGTTLNRKTRRIEGQAINKSDHAYTDIQITFALPSRDQTAQDWSIVAVARLEPHTSARFASDPLPNGVREWAFVGITGTPK